MTELSQPVEVEILCKNSRSTIQEKCFYFSKNRPLHDLREILITVFELEGFLAQFRFYNEKKQIKTIADIDEGEPKSGEKRYKVTLELEFQGG
jgi:hypothetical protein